MIRSLLALRQNADPLRSVDDAAHAHLGAQEVWAVSGSNGFRFHQLGIAGHSGTGDLDKKGSKPWGMLSFNGTITDAFKRYTRKLLSEPNRYTKIAIKDDPTVMGLLCAAAGHGGPPAARMSALPTSMNRRQ